MNRTHTLSVPAGIRRLLLAWMIAVTAEYLRLPREMRILSDNALTTSLSPVRTALITLLIAMLLWGLSLFCRTQAAERWGIVAMLSLSSALFCTSPFSPVFGGICLLLIAVAAFYACLGWRGDFSEAVPTPSCPVCLGVTAVLTAIFFLFVSLWTVSRVLSLRTPTYDFGIFSQMFYYMESVGQPLTTLERDGLLSHFHVHMSPIYYLLLPFYRLIPHPATLQVCQAAVIASAVIPLWKLGTHHGLTAPQRTWLCAALLLYPALAGGTSYDLHENCFLTPLILWLFLGIDRKNIPLTLLSALLVLSVKEDAAVYVAIIGLWLIVRALLHRVSRHRQDLLMGCLLFVISLICFLLVTGYLHRIGDGVMTGRYQNLMPEGEDSLLAVVRTALTNPMKVLFECADREKLEYIALTMLPLLGLPLLTRRYERYLLLFPWILVNLMPDYLYQHSIFFQYSFGSLAFLFYLTAVNLADLRSSRRTLSLLALTAVSAASFAFTVLPKAVGYVSEYTQNRAHYQEVYNCLATIPEDASVTATTFYTTPLSRREELYDLGYTSKEQLLQTEYIVVDPGLEGEFSRYTKPGRENGFSNLAALLLRDGYREYARVGHVLIIFARDP